MSNEETKKIIKRYRLFHYEIAEIIGVQESLFSKWFRKELSQDQVYLIMNAINQLKEDMNDSN